MSSGLPKQEPLRLGIWFYYGQTLPPNEGIGVFVHNLTAGLLALPENVECTLLIRPGDEAVVEPLRAQLPIAFESCRKDRCESAGSIRAG